MKTPKNDPWPVARTITEKFIHYLIPIREVASPSMNKKNSELQSDKVNQPNCVNLRYTIPIPPTKLLARILKK